MEVLALPLVAAGITKAVDMIRNMLSSVSLPKWVWNVLAFVLGILAAFALNVELVSIPEGMLRFKVSGVGLQILTGIVLGGLASGWHELFDLWSSRAKAAAEPTP